MEKATNITQKFLPCSTALLSAFAVLLSAFAVYKGRTDDAIYLMLVALYTRNTIDVTVIMSKDDDKEVDE